MKILTVNSLCGVKNQLYCQDQYVELEGKKIVNGFFDVNSLFWSTIFDIKNVTLLLERAQNELKDDNSPKVQALLSNIDILDYQRLQVYLSQCSSDQLSAILAIVEAYLRTYKSPV